MAQATDLMQLREVLDDLSRAAESCAPNWTQPTRAGKWSPAQIVEHVARAVEESAKDIRGEPSRMIQLPAPLRFLARKLGYERVLRDGRLGKAKTNPAMNPHEGPADAEAGRARLEAAWRTLSDSVASHTGPARSRIFGTVPLDGYLRFQALHARHHAEQLKAAARSV